MKIGTFSSHLMQYSVKRAIFKACNGIIEDLAFFSHFAWASFAMIYSSPAPHWLLEPIIPRKAMEGVIVNICLDVFGSNSVLLQCYCSIYTFPDFCPQVQTALHCLTDVIDSVLLCNNSGRNEYNFCVV